jgi:hypothetical protein
MCRYSLDRIEVAFFNHDSEGESCNGEWERKREEWASFCAHLYDDSKHDQPPEATPDNTEG